MSDKKCDERCTICNIPTKKSRGKVKKILTEEDMIQYQEYCTANVEIGSVFCGKCRLIIYRGPKQRDSDSDNEIDDDATKDADFISPRIEVSETSIELPFKRVVSTHKYCIICESRNQLNVIPLEARLQAFSQLRIYIPKGNRCCTTHLIKKRFYADNLQLLRIHSLSSSIEISEVSFFLENMAINVDSSLLSRIENFSLSEEQLHTFTGLNWENIEKLRGLLISLRNSEARTVTQALVTFLFKLRSGSSNQMIKNILGLKHEQQVSNYFHQIIEAFEKDILPNQFGINARTREDLVGNETAPITRELFEMDRSVLAIILDGTYVRHEKSGNNEYQRKSYSGQKKTPLCKPFTICTTNGYIIDTAGPFNGNMNDASIMKILLEDPTGLKTLLRPGDYCIVDRGFRDVVQYMKEQGYNVLMPACKGNRAQLTSQEANDSRFITKIRWVVEAVHGALGQKFRLLHHRMDNKLLPSLKSVCRIASFLHNTFGKRLNSDPELTNTIVDYMKERKNQHNTLKELIETENLSRRKKPFTTMTATSLMDFPELTERDLKILFTGMYQLSQAVCYLAELMKDQVSLNIEYLKENDKILRMKIHSRHINRKTYHSYIEYEPNSIGYTAIKRYSCDCANGNRTVGCCSHVAAIIYYLPNGRFQSKILRPSEILTRIFDATDTTAVIEEDSDDD